MASVVSLRTALTRLWRADRPLTAGGLLMLAALAVFAVGLVIDPRTITGAPAWLKPAKFAVSTAIYMLTLAWVFGHISEWPRVRRLVSRTTVTVLVLEVGIIALQAWRGTTSHFNNATTLDAALFSVMGLAIVVQTLMSVLVAVALWRQQFADHALGWALRLGMTLTIIGATSGGLMTAPTSAQLADAQIKQTIPTIGAHTVGAPDGGPGLPGTGWSLAHGDLRVPHFLGLHALQMLPLLAWFLSRRRLEAARRAHLVIAAGGSHLGLFLILMWQALRRQSLVDPDMATIVALAVWAVATGVAVWPFRGRHTSADVDSALNWINP